MKHKKIKLLHPIRFKEIYSSLYSYNKNHSHIEGIIMLIVFVCNTNKIFTNKIPITKITPG